MSTYFFLFNLNIADTLKTLDSLKTQTGLDRIVVFENTALPKEQHLSLKDIEIVSTKSQSFNHSVLKKINTFKATYNFLYLKTTPLRIGYRAIERIKASAKESNTLSYADFAEIKSGTLQPHPLIDYQEGSVRNDFEFGSLQLYRGPFDEQKSYQFAALYAEQLRRRKVHIPEQLYIEEESDLRKSGEKQFDYVNPAMRQVQEEMEKAFTEHLKEQGLLITPDMIRLANLSATFRLEASVIIPVRNREKTIADAIRSALAQDTTFNYNVIVVDNHSTDKTSAAIEAVRKEDSRVVHLQPERDDLGIGGCWDLAIRSEHCGKFAVQLDSDDLYSSRDTLQRIINKFYQTRAAMVIGSYSLVDFNLQPLPPGLIDHKEWTDTNGMNNALRINGLGAPRAFFVPVLREIGFPNTSYGEDYAVGLAISRRYRIGRIYDNLYLCRRWDGNSDAALSVEKINRNNLYKDWIRTQEIKTRRQLLSKPNRAAIDALFESQMKRWPQVSQRFEELDTKVSKRQFKTTSGLTFEAQFNPARIRSTGAKLDKQSIAQRRCFLCQDNQPSEQEHLNYGGRYQLCINPFPILHRHLTIPLMAHKSQAIEGRFKDLAELVSLMPNMVIFYNGAECGASAPDHFHFQAGAIDEIPLQRDIEQYLSGAEKLSGSIYLIKSFAYPFFFAQNIEQTESIVRALPLIEGEQEPRFNLIAWQKGSIVIPRRKLRPDCYFKEGEENYCISPGAVDMGGLIITPKEQDFRRITGEKISEILKEVALSLSELQPTINALS